ncbi:OmpA family protein [Chthonobacter rhizosphaerae]|uniref:OmpA family protein n=1 Tax=Chthonobacter rhizosphaerae TaxID=2735553 RepID=UPI0015EEB9B0|nr:OmpA family protein [Chthonobacter rhizosphaerae]
MGILRTCILAAGIAVATAAPPARAETGCAATLASLQSSYGGGDVAAVIAGWKAVEADASCSAAQVTGARSQVSAAIAKMAQEKLSAGDATAADAIVRQAPGVHWAVQAVRGDIAARKGDRPEAAKLYNAALDSLGDPALTAQTEALVPIAGRLALLAQENMMLAGSMEATVTRGGEATGVMAVIARGLAVERANPAVATATQSPAPPQPPAPAQTLAPTPSQPAAPQQTALVTVQEAGAQASAPAPAEPPAQSPGQVAAKASDAAAGVQFDGVQIQSGNTFNVISAAALQVQSVFLPIRFGFDSDQLDGDGTREAQRLAAFLKANRVAGVVIAGHTDDVGDPTYNLDLSLRRARALADFLVKDGVPSRIQIVGKGEAEPPAVVDAQIYSTDELRTIARRVEVAFGS